MGCFCNLHVSHISLSTAAPLNFCSTGTSEPQPLIFLRVSNKYPLQCPSFKEKISKDTLCSNLMYCGAVYDKLRLPKLASKTNSFALSQPILWPIQKDMEWRAGVELLFLKSNLFVWILPSAFVFTSYYLLLFWVMDVTRLDGARARSKFGAPMFEPDVFRKQMYCIEENTCDIVWTFLRPPQWFGVPRMIRHPGSCASLCPPVTYLFLRKIRVNNARSYFLCF